MKKLLYELLIVALGLTGINLFKRITEDSDQKVKFHVYNNRTGNLIGSIFRTIPATYDTMIDLEIIEPYSKELNLYRVNLDIYGGTPDIHYVVYDKDNHEIKELKSDFLASEIESFDYDTILASLIDKSVFRQIFDGRLTMEEQIADKCAELLANSLSSADFKKIKDESDLLDILNSHQKTHSPMIDEKETISDFSFLGDLSDNEFLYWFYDHGLVKLTIDMKDGHFDNLKTLRIGNLGVEIIHL